MKAINRIIERARSSPRRIVLCEAEDPRMLEAAQRATREGIARIALVGLQEPIQDLPAPRKRPVDCW